MKILIILSLILSGCSSQRMGNSQPVELINATSQQWYGGAAGSGQGIDYKFFFKKNTDDAISFDTVWIKERPYVPQMRNVSFPQQHIEKGHQFSLNMQYRKSENHYTGETEESPEINKSNSPQFSGDALIIYKVNGERKTMIVKTLEVQEPNFYP